MFEGFVAETIFTKIINREIPADIVHEDDLTIAFRDVSPQAPVHILVIPKKPIDRIENATEEDEAVLGRMMFVASRIAKAEGLEDGYRLVMNNGEHGGQTVFHIHLHLLGGRPLRMPLG